MLLGIDIGTSKVAAVLVDDEGTVAASASRPHGANLPAGAARAEQDAESLLRAAVAAVGELPGDLRSRVRAVGVTGQMHGAVVLDGSGRALTPLITWRDGRCLEGGFLNRLNARLGGRADGRAFAGRLRSGFGCATLAWLAENGTMPAKAAVASTVADLAVARLCGSPRPVTDPTHAASWGLFDLRTAGWDASGLKTAGIPAGLLPEVVPCGRTAGDVCVEFAAALGVPPGIPIAAAVGDNQASLLATLDEPAKELALTLGTGGQVSAVLPGGGPYEEVPPDCPYEYRPFPADKRLIVASCLCGGAAWAWLAETAAAWAGDLGLPPPPRETLFERMNTLGAKAPGGLSIQPHFLGERHDASLRASISGIDLRNFTLGGVAGALARGIVRNLRDMLPAWALDGREKVVGSGNALRRNPLLRSAAAEVFGLPLRMSACPEEAAVGAALLAGGALPGRKSGDAGRTAS